VKLTSSTWQVLVNGGLTASASGSATGMPSSWNTASWNGAAESGGGGNVEISHIHILPGLLPDYRILARYAAAIDGCGALPAPTSPALSTVENLAPTGLTPDGSAYQGSYGSGLVPFGFSLVTASVAGDYTSGPSARAVTAGYGAESDDGSYGAAVWASWTALAPAVNLYTADQATMETGAAVCLGSGNSFTSGYGSAAVSQGVCEFDTGSGAAPPAAASALGDTVQQRIERCLGYGLVTFPGRAIDPAPLLVQAALDIGGQATGQNCVNQQLSDDGLLAVDNVGVLGYRQRPHLASDTPIWQLGPDVSAGQIPYKADQSFSNDPVKVWNTIAITPYSPDGASLPDITPANVTAVDASQIQYGSRPLTTTSYLQSTSEIQSQANWLESEFGTMRRRVEKLTIDAASHPAAWGFVLGCNCSDLASVSDQPFGGPATTGTYRVTQISGRSFSMGANGTTVEAAVTVICDFEPSSWWE
jgi:hypothetical protein